MAAVTVVNTDWEIIEDIDEALTAATISAVTVFKQVTATTSDPQAKQAQFTGAHPLVILLYETTTEDDCAEDVRSGAVRLTLIVATKADPARDESARLKEILRLKNAAMNAVEGTAPSDASAWAAEASTHEAIEWGEPVIDITEAAPWIVCRLPLEIGYVLDTGTQH